MPLTKCSECDILPAHHEYTVYKLKLACLEYYDKRGINNLNRITYKNYQTRKTSIVLAELSKSATLLENSRSNESNENKNKGLIEENESLSITITEQINQI